ncbi:MAG: MFS transporter [Deltaproteobacteria bacterium]|jgi:predicted MFS family arabinose efflux permease|nr:MFS transporter [Deltaproteobacteria bacterium]
MKYNQIIRSWPFWVAIVLLMASQTLYLSLSATYLSDFRRNAAWNMENFTLSRLAQKLSFVVSLGVDLESCLWLEVEASKAAKRANLSSGRLVIFSKTGRPLASDKPEFSHLPATWPTILETDQPWPLKYLGRDFRAWGVFNSERKLKGVLALANEEIPFTQSLISLAKVIGFGGLALGLIAFFIVFIFAMDRWKRLANKNSEKFPPSVGMILLWPFLVGQLFFAGLTFHTLFVYQLEQTRILASQLAANLANDLDKITQAGVGLEEIIDLPRRLGDSSLESPLVTATLVKTDGLTINPTTLPPTPDPSMVVTWPLAYGGQVEAWLNPTNLRQAKINLALDNLALTLASGLALWELARLLDYKAQSDFKTRANLKALVESNQTSLKSNIDDLQSQIDLNYQTNIKHQSYLEKQVDLKIQAQNNTPPTRPQPKIPLNETAITPEAARTLRLIRPLAFIALMAANFSMAFNPIKMTQISHSWLGFSKETMACFPVALEMGMIGFAIVLVPKLTIILKKLKRLIAWGLALAGLGELMSALASDSLVFCLARGLSGLGYGFFSIGASILTSQCAGIKKLGQSLGELSAGNCSGAICGCLIGGLTAEFLGFNLVYVLASGLFLMLALFWPRLHEGFSFQVRTPISKTFKLIFSRNVLFFAICVTIPIEGAYLGLESYFIPLHAVALHQGPALVSRLTGVMSLVTIIFGPKFGHILDQRGNPRAFIFATGFLSALSIPIFTAWPTLFGAILGVIILGLAKALGSSSLVVYFLSMPQSKSLGNAPALAINTILIRLGNTLGPLILGATWGGFGFKGLVILGLMVFCLSLLFFILGNKFPQQTEYDGDPSDSELSIDLNHNLKSSQHATGSTI